MSDKDLGLPAIGGYLLLWWGGVAGLLVWITANTAPGAPELAWSSEAFTTTQKLDIDIVAHAPDVDGDSVDYFFAWKRNGEPILTEGGDPYVARTLPPRDTRAGDEIEVTVTPDDGTMGSWGCNWPWRECAGNISATLTTTIANTPPRARVRVVDAEDKGLDEPTFRDDLHLRLACRDADFADQAADARARGEEPELEEGETPPDPCTYSVAWFQIEYDADGEEIELEEDAEPVSEEPILASRLTKRGQTWLVRVTANDGIEDGEPVEERVRIAD